MESRAWTKLSGVDAPKIEDAEKLVDLRNIVVGRAFNGRSTRSPKRLQNDLLTLGRIIPDGPTTMNFNPFMVQTSCQTPLGIVTLAASPNGLAGVWFEGQRHLPAELLGQAWPQQATHPILQESTRQLHAYFKGSLSHFDLPLDLSAGTVFAQSVWRALQTIAYGATSHYGNISQTIGQPKAARAVGGAIGRNPLSIVVPCHRVLGRNGLLTGYAGGLERKMALLQLEGARPRQT
jgi:methylated-DNA-[protein]-cysteine S-methyltransferase